MKEVVVPRVKVWERKDDEVISKIAAKNVGRKWEVVKACVSVIDDGNELFEGLTLKEKLKEGVWWQNVERKNYLEWKTRNMRSLNLKESSAKPAAVPGPMEKFCTMKGLARIKFDLEDRTEKENCNFENELKEITLERKLARSKKKKLDLYRKCRKRLEILTNDWKSMKDQEEMSNSKKLKEEAMKERIRKQMKETKQDSRREEVRDPTSLEIKPPIVTNKATFTESDVNQFVAMRPADLGCDNVPTVPYSARFGCKLNKMKITKPQLQMESRRSEAVLPAMDRAVPPMRDEPVDGTGPFGQSEVVQEIEQRRGRQEPILKKQPQPEI